MKDRNPLLLTSRMTIASLVTATVGVIMQIVSGADYPAVPPVFFILLIPAGLIAFGRWRWATVTAVAAGLFLTVGLFASGASRRLFEPNRIGDSVGLWVQMLAVVVATVSGMIATVQNYASGHKLMSVNPE